MSTATASTALAKTGGASTIMHLVVAKKEALAAVATKHLTADKLIKIVGAAMSRNPKLAQCTPMSILQCCMTAAELGLAPTLGRIHFVPFKNNKAGGVMEAQVIVGYQGLCDLMRRSGMVGAITAEVVREGDHFRYRLGVDATVEHTPKADRSAKMTHAYAVAHLKGGGAQVVVMTAAEVLAIKAESKSVKLGFDSPWKDKNFEPEMWKKTAVRRLAKLAPMSVEDQQAVSIVDDLEYKFDQLAEVVADAEASEPPTASGIADELNGQVEAAEQKAEENQDRQPTAAEQKRKKDAADLAAKSKPAPKVPTCKPGKAGCGGDFSTVKIDGKPYALCAEHAPQFQT